MNVFILEDILMLQVVAVDNRIHQFVYVILLEALPNDSLISFFLVFEEFTALDSPTFYSFTRQ